MRSIVVVLLCLITATGVAALDRPFIFAPEQIPPAIYVHNDPGDENSALCGEIIDHYAELGVNTAEMCTISLPRDESIRRPNWRPLDPAAHPGLIKEAFFWQFLDSQVNFERYYNSEHRAFIEDLATAWGHDRDNWRPSPPKDVDPALFERAWTLFGEPVREMIAAGAIRLETARFDLNFDGELDTVYRMSHLVFHVPRRPSDPTAIGVQIWRCETARNRVEDHPYVLFVSSAEAPQVANGGSNIWSSGMRNEINHMNDVFWRDGRPYVVWILRGIPTFVVRETNAGPRRSRDEPAHGFSFTRVCQMHRRPGL
jgi:hypothetical protein